MTVENKFRHKFKYYKQKMPEPCLATVIDPHSAQYASCFTPCSAATPHVISPAGLNASPPANWRVLSSNLSPGFHIITGALEPEHELYWTHRCLSDYSSPPSRRNIDTVNPESGDWFAEALAAGAVSGLADRLRWATMGYHHNWDTKVGFTYSFYLLVLLMLKCTYGCFLKLIFSPEVKVIGMLLMIISSH